MKAIKSDNYQTLLHFLMSPLQISAMLNVLIFTAWRITQYVRLKKINLGCQLFFGDWSFLILFWHAGTSHAHIRTPYRPQIALEALSLNEIVPVGNRLC